ncbi:nuclease [Aphanothece hegewaldii CCALA 016]|uniref:Nuclease n=1 Tax=Aphanothece hegewaldii CCALA 016 TaxID=2107694 RepID=A0A2T1LU33_9CHRO|nr:nuclease-related domain-containing protein [Aphanothece hegewaldii]PSF34952.1 nuclease [Aphanothece hegewaldii CCALA 016]
MRVLRQSEPIQTIRKQMIAAKTRSSRGKQNSLLYDLSQWRNNTIGSLGENAIAGLLHSLPDSWLMMNNAIIPTKTGNLTEIDCILINSTGVYLIEVKTWKGSFAAYKDKWKRRDRDKWVFLENSPTEQSKYHQRIFTEWLTSHVSNLPKDCIIAPVIFPIAKWIGVTECSVPVFSKFNDFLKLIESRSQIFEQDTIEQIAQLLVNVKVRDFDPALLVKYQNAQLKELFRII